MEEDSFSSVLSILVPALIVAVGACVVHSMPAGMLTLLTAWVLTSFPAGILFGHCALGED